MSNSNNNNHKRSTTICNYCNCIVLYLQQGSCVTTNSFGCTLNGCCNSNSICKLPCVPSSSATFAPTSSPSFSTCLCNWSTAGLKTNSDCCPGLEYNVYNGWSQCRGKYDTFKWDCIDSALNIIIQSSYFYRATKSTKWKLHWSW